MVSKVLQPGLRIFRIGDFGGRKPHSLKLKKTGSQKPERDAASVKKNNQMKKKK